MVDSSEIIQRSKLHPSRVKCIYMYGSRVYGNITNSSDWDFIIIANNSSPSQEIRSGDYNIHILTPDHFSSLLRDHNPGAIECFYLPDEYRLLEEIEINFNLKLPSLRHSFSHVSSNSWIKCRKKMDQGDTYVGLKSIFHSLRIPMFGSQIAKYGKISDYSCANKYHDKIFSKEWEWEELDLFFRPIRNQILSDFRSVTSK